jgi:hypothetical protein
MKDMTQYILVWLTCCKEVWERWFKELDNGEDEFGEVEQALFSSLVLSATNMIDRPGLPDCYQLLSAVYREDVNGYRSVCKQQKAGNIYCESKVMKFKKGASLPIKSIDFMGRMLDGTPYAELKLNEREFILEPVENLNIMMNI